MINTRLYLNEQEVDLWAGTAIAETKQVNDIADLSSRNANYTNRIKLPKTQRNHSILQHSDLIQSPTKLPYSRLRVKLVRDGIEVITDGLAIIQSSDDHYHIEVYSGIMDLFATIGDKYLSALDLSDYDHAFDQPTALASWTNTDGYKYSLINYGDLPVGTMTVELSNQRPLFFVHRLVKEIITQAGFRYEGEIFSNPDFNKLLVTMFNGDESSPYFDKEDRMIMGESIPHPGPEIACIVLNANETADVEFRLVFRINTWTNSLSTFYIRISISGGVGPQFTYTHTDAEGAGVFDLSFTASCYNSDLAPHSIVIQVYGNDCEWRFATGEISGKISGGIHSLPVPDESNFYCRILPYPSDATFAINQIIYLGLTTDAGLIPDIGVIVQVARHMPNLKQKDFLKGILQMFGLLVHLDPHRKIIRLVGFNEIAENIPYARDWSDKLHWQKNKHKIEYRLGSYARQNSMKFAEDSNDSPLTLGIGDGVILSDNENAEENGNLFTLPFAASRMGWVLGGAESAPQIPRTVDGVIEGNIIPRILIDNVHSIAPVYAFDYTDGFTTSSEYTNVPFCYFIMGGKEFNLNFKTSLGRYYTALSQVLNKCKRITVKMKLDVIDVADFDHTLPIYLSQYAAYFYVNKIVNFTGSGLTQVELIRLQTDYTSQSTEDVNAIDPPENYELQEDGGFSLGEDGSILLREDGN